MTSEYRQFRRQSTSLSNMGFFVSTKSAVLIVLLFVGICVCVGLLAGLLKAPSDGTSSEGDSGGQVGDSTTTSSTSAGTTTTTTAAPTEEPGPWTHPFLPDNTKPLHYDLYLDPDFYYEGNTYEGSVAIEIHVTSETRYLIVHYKMMTISKTEVKQGSQTLDISRTFGYDANQFWVTEMAEPISAGSVVQLHLEFNSSLVNGIVGFYKSTYINTLTQQESWLATSKFQPTDARKAFPNFDEPKYKATFTVTLRHWSNFTALANMEEETHVDDDAIWRKTTFQRSYPMSSYLVCFIVCDFEKKEQRMQNGKMHRVWATPDKRDQINYALELGTKVANFFEDEFEMEYHLPKLDQVAIPDFPSGAMEHWGLITYRETSLLYNETLASSAAQERVALVIAHELAHNYFGNAVTCEWWDEIWLNEGFANFYESKGGAAAEPTWEWYFGNSVTCAWWDEIWLNEGFARFYQYLGIKDVHPDWLVDDYFVVRTQQGVMRTDAGASSRPVVVRVTHPDDINQAFDGITYDKGASVLRMIESFMGKERFRDGIRAYLKKHENGTVVTQDLWDSLQDIMGDEMNVTEVMEPWVKQMGLPVVNIAEDSGDIIATPRRFLQNPEADTSLPESIYNYEWYVPLSYDLGDTNGSKWLNKSHLAFADPRDSNSDYLKFNIRQSGFYRVNYPVIWWNDFAALLNSNQAIFDPIERSNLLDDAFNLARATQLDYPTVLTLTEYMMDEMHYFPWRSAYSAITYINSLVYGEPDYYLWRRYVRELSYNVMERLQVDGPEMGHLDNMLRAYIISLACSNSNEGCLKNTSEIFTAWIHDDTYEVSPNIRQEVYTYGMREVGSEPEWNLMWQRYELAESAQEKLYLLRGLAQAPQLYLLQRYLDYCMDEEKVRRQDFFTAVSYASSNPHGELYVWNWAQMHYDEFIARFTIQDRYFGRMIPDLVSGFKTEFQLAEVEAFFDKYPDAGAGETPRAQALETIRNNIEWKARNEQSVFNWLLHKYNVQ